MAAFLGCLIGLWAGRTVVVRGKILFQDGTRPAEEVYIERRCPGTIRRETTVDREGNFAFRIAEEGLDLSGQGGFRACDVRAILPGYTSSVVALATVIDGVTGQSDVNVGTLILRRNETAPDLVVDAASLSVPKKSREAYEKGVKALQKGRNQHARREFEKAVREYPAHAAAHLRLAELCARERNWEGVAHAAEKGIQADASRFPALHVLKAFAHFNLGDLKTAEASAREALRLDIHQQHPKAEHILGVICIKKGEVAEAARHLRAYLKLAPNAADAGAVRQELLTLREEPR